MPNVGRKKGRTGRNAGTGIAKMSRSRWKTYAVLIAHQNARRAETLERKLCPECATQYHSRGALKRHRCIEA
jgi:hypothetical protein